MGKRRLRRKGVGKQGTGTGWGGKGAARVGPEPQSPPFTPTFLDA